MDSKSGSSPSLLRNRQKLLDFSLRSLIDLRAEEIPDLFFLLVGGSASPLSYHDLKEACVSIARSFMREGYGAGEAVAMMLPNGRASALVLLSVMYSGRVLCPLNLAAGNAQLAYILEHSEATMLLVAPELRERANLFMENHPEPPKVIEVDPDGIPFSGENHTDTLSEGVPDVEDTALLMYTSGTTGKPKGVLLSHRSLVAGGMNATESHSLEPEDRALCVLPLYHINGLINTVMGPLVSGGSVFMPPKFQSSEFWKWIEEYRCTWFSIVPTLLSSLLHKTSLSTEQRKRLGSHLRFGRSASAPLAPEVHHQFEKKFGVPVIETMGLTETSSPILSNPLPPGRIKYGSPGIPWGNEVRIVDGELRTVSNGTEGEIAVRGDNVMKGYFKNPDVTRETLREGWLLTGDIGVMDEDGYVFVRGRTKELIIKGGENIAPREIDEALYEHGEVVEAAAFAVDHSHYGQDVEACVILADGASCDDSELRDFCEPRLGAFKTPSRIHFVRELPKGPSGKIQRLRLAEWTRDKGKK